MKKKVITKLKDMALTVFDKYSVYESDNLLHSFTLTIHTKSKALINKYTISVIEACGYPIDYGYDYFYHYNTKDIAGFIITFTDKVKT